MFVDWIWPYGSRLETVPDPGSNTFFGASSCRLIGPIYTFVILGSAQPWLGR